MSDESILNLSDSTKSAMRNYAMVAGFMALFIYSTVLIVGLATDSMMNMSAVFPAVISSVLMIVGIILALLHKRDLVAITFILLASTQIITLLTMTVFGSPMIQHVPYNIAMIFVAVVMMFTRNEQRYICFLTLLPISLCSCLGSTLGSRESVSRDMRFWRQFPYMPSYA